LRILAALAALVLLYAGWVGWGFVSSKPQIAGERRMAGLQAPVQIVRDAHGAAHIFGANDHDVYFALGYAHAQDRFFQMDVTRRSTEGRVSEIVGTLGLKLDARARIEGFAGLVDTLTAALTPDLRANLEAYAAGVNARLASGAPSPEYAILLVKPAPWRVEDSVAVGLAMVNNLTLGDGEDLARAALAEKLTPAEIAQFLPPYPDWAPRSIDAADLPALGAPAPARAGVTDRAAPGSNAWVLSGAHTKSGKPLLANDPHLDFAEPAPFYLVHLRLSGGNLVGATLPGAPLIVIGRNDRIAWTNTTNEIDSADLIAAPAGGFENVRTRTETIVVRDWFGFSHKETISARRAPDGPILDPAYFNLKAYKGRPVMLRSAALDPHNRVFSAIAAMTGAQSVAGFIAASEGWTAPMTHELVASTDGDIGLVSTGWLPLRDESGAWAGSVPWTAQPNIENPKSGIIVTANNLATPAAYPYPMPGAFATYRITRIRTLLDQGAGADLDAAAAMQMDVASVFAERVLPPLVAMAAPQTPAGAAALAKLKTWDGAMEGERPEPLIFAAWIGALSRAVYEDDLGPDLFKLYAGPRQNFLDTVFTGPAAAWCDRKGTPQRETCAALAGPALDEAAAALAKRYGDDQDRWRWRAAHQANFAHPLFGAMPLLGALFDVRQGVGGDAGTIFAGAYEGEDFTDRHGPSFRVVYDLSDLNRSRFVIAPGQSGHPLSPHFKDLLDDWASRRGFEIRTDFDPAKPPPGSSTLTLTPN
jgi:penicillin amidase